MLATRFMRWKLWPALLVGIAVQAGCGGEDASPDRKLKAAVATAAAPAPTFQFYGTTFEGSEPYASTLLGVSAADGQQTVLGTVGSALARRAIDIDPTTGLLFGVDGSTTPGALLSIDLTTGQSRTVGTIRDGFGRPVTLVGLTFAADGTLYAATPVNIGRVDRSTYRYTEFLVVPSTVSVVSIEMSPAGVLYAAYHARTGASQTLVSIDPTTMSVTRSIDIIGDFAVGELDFAPDGYLYHTNYSHTLVRLDPATGVQTMVGNDKIGALAAIASAPAVDTTALFDWAERIYPQFFPSHQGSRTALPYVYRFYPESGNYLGVAGTTIAILGPMTNGAIVTVGQVADFACQVTPTSCAAPTIGTSPAAVFVTAPAAATFSVAASGSPTPGYQWQVSANGSTFTNIEGAKSSSYTLPTTTLADHGKQFRAVVSNPAGSVTSAAATLSVGAAIGSYAFSALTAKLNVPRAMHAATTLADGRVLITGGTSSGVFPGPALDTAELYDPSSGSFRTLAARMRSPRIQHTATLLADGKVLLTGGQADNTDGNGVATAELFDPATQTFSSLPSSMASPRGGHAASMLADGKVLITGGFNRGAGTLGSDAEIYDPVSRSFAALGAKMVAQTKSHRSTRLPNGKVLITGGVASNTMRIVPEQFDPATQTFSAVSGRLASTRWGHESTRLPSGAVLISGGVATYNLVQVGALTSAEAFEPSTGVFSLVSASMGSARGNHAATLLNDGSVLLVGGIRSGLNGSFVILDSAEVFKPAASVGKPTVTLSADATTLSLGAGTTLRWSSTLADSCSASGGWSGSRTTAGSLSITPAAAGTASYTLTCTGPGGSASATATVVVQPPVRVPTVSLSAAATTALAGSSVTLNWTSTNSTTCTASGDWSGSKASAGGSETLSVGTTLGQRTYALACTGPGGSASSSVTVNVVSPPSGGQCEVISMGPTQLTVRNNLPSGVTVYLPDFGFAADMWSGECDIIGMDFLGQPKFLKLELTQCTSGLEDSDCTNRTFGPTKKLTINLLSGSATLEINPSMFGP